MAVSWPFHGVIWAISAITGPGPGANSARIAAVDPFGLANASTSTGSNSTSPGVR